MPNTRKKIIKTVYKDEESEGEAGDFSDSGSDAKISEVSTSEEDAEDDVVDERSSPDVSRSKQKKTTNPPLLKRPKLFAKELIKKISKQDLYVDNDNDIQQSSFSVRDLKDAEKLLPSVLNLSESDSSDDESYIKSKKKKATATLTSVQEQYSDSDDCRKVEYHDVWSKNIQDNSENIAKTTFQELERHNDEIERTKASIDSYVAKNNVGAKFNVKDLLAQGEEVVKEESPIKKRTKLQKDSDSELEDWEEVHESKIPQQGLQLIVELPNAICRKSKSIDVEMMMKRKINRVKKEYQVYMHKVHILCWLGHGNYVSRVLNEQEVMAAALAMVPKDCYPEERLTMKYVEQITTWFKDKLTLKQDKNEHKFKPKAAPLKDIILNQIKSRVTTAKKYNIFIFVAMLRALGLQCRIMFNLVAVPIRPHSSELCSLSTKAKDDKSKEFDKTSDKNAAKDKPNTSIKSNSKRKKNIAQVDGIDGLCESDSECDNIMQIDGSDDTNNTRSTRSTRAKKQLTNNNKIDGDEDVSPPKRLKSKVQPEKHVNIETKEQKSAMIHTTKSINIDVPSTSKDTGKTRKSPIRRLNINKDDTMMPKNADNSSKEASGESNNCDILQGASISNVTRPALKTRASKNNITSAKDVPSKSNNKQKVTKLQTKRSNRNHVESGISNGSIKSDLKLLEPLTKVIPSENTSTKRKTLKSPQARNKTFVLKSNESEKDSSAKNDDIKSTVVNAPSPRKTRSNSRNSAKTDTEALNNRLYTKLPSITITNECNESYISKEESAKHPRLSRKRSHTTIVNTAQTDESKTKPTIRTKSVPGSSVVASKYFNSGEVAGKVPKQTKKEQNVEDSLRVSHRELSKSKAKAKNDVTGDLVEIIKGRIKAKQVDARTRIVKGKVKEDSDDDSDFLPVEDAKSRDSDDDFKPMKISPRPSIRSKPSTSKKIDRRVLSSDDDIIKSNKMDVWCEIYVEELEQWIAVDAIKGKVHCSNDLYTQATHPICYIVGWDNTNYLKDLTRRYVPHWNTVTRKQRAETDWWTVALRPWLGPKTPQDREENEYLDRMQLDAPLPKSIAEYKNHPLYALKRHLLKFEALYPPDAATLGFVRGEAVYRRDCVYTCRSRDVWLKEAKTVKLGEQPYKIVKARPKWDRLSNKLITDKPLEVFGPWQVQEYEPPVAENGKVPRNAYGNVELFKDCMLPKKTVHIKLPGLNKVARKLNIDCAPAMTGFDFNGGWSHPVYDGFVVCEEFEEIITDAWLKEQEEQERREREKVELRVYGHWKKLIRGLMIRERLKAKYGFEEPTTSQAKPKKGPRLVVKKK